MTQQFVIDEKRRLCLPEPDVPAVTAA